MKTANDAKKFFNEYLPMFNPVIKEEDYKIFAEKKMSHLPTFMYAGPHIFKGQTTALLGDSIHTVKPYFGLGLNTAFEDILALNK